jgi:PhnB protein
MMKIQPYLSFEGRCEEAFEFYKVALGAEAVVLMRFKDNPEPPEVSMVSHGSENKIMHMEFRIGETSILASDGQCTGHTGFQGITLTITAADEAEADRVFANLDTGGQVMMPLSKTFFSPKFGIVADRFGVSWMVIVVH